MLLSLLCGALIMASFDRLFSPGLGRSASRDVRNASQRMAMRLPGQVGQGQQQQDRQGGGVEPTPGAHAPGIARPCINAYTMQAHVGPCMRVPGAHGLAAHTHAAHTRA